MNVANALLQQVLLSLYQSRFNLLCSQYVSYRYNLLQDPMFYNNTSVCINPYTMVYIFLYVCITRYNSLQNSMFYNNTSVCINPYTTFYVFPYVYRTDTTHSRTWPCPINNTSGYDTVFSLYLSFKIQFELTLCFSIRELIRVKK